jgi:hypothetical protein
MKGKLLGCAEGKILGNDDGDEEGWREGSVLGRAVG